MTEPNIRGLVARRMVSLADIPKGSRPGRLPGAVGATVTAFVASESQVEAFEFADIKNAGRFMHSAASFLQVRNRRGERIAARATQRGTTVYLIRTPESSNGQVRP